MFGHTHHGKSATSLFLSLVALLPSVGAWAQPVACRPGEMCAVHDTFLHRDFFNLGIEHGSDGVLRVNYHLQKPGRSSPSSSIKSESRYWLLGAGMVQWRETLAEREDPALARPAGHAGLGYVWSDENAARHVVEFRASYPQVVGVHYMYAF